MVDMLRTLVVAIAIKLNKLFSNIKEYEIFGKYKRLYTKETLKDVMIYKILYFAAVLRETTWNWPSRHLGKMELVLEPLLLSMPIPQDYLHLLVLNMLV